MDSQLRAFELPFEAHVSCGTPPRCPRAMTAQTIQVWTPTRILGVLLMAMLSAPRIAIAAPALIGRGRRA
jgi:hypothetical protein